MRPVMMKWDGKNHRMMFDFLTFGQLRDEYMVAEWDTFTINHNVVPGGLCLKTPEGVKPVPIGHYVFLSVDGNTFDTSPEMEMIHFMAVASLIGASDSK